MLNISIELAQQLQVAGLVWHPQWHDFFAIPNTNTDQQVFVLSDMTVAREVLHGLPAFTFVGAVEWALDYILQAEAIWLPTESQLRHQIQMRLAHAPQPAIILHSSPLEYRCELNLNAGRREFIGNEASEAYAHALLYLLAKNDA